MILSKHPLHSMQSSGQQCCIDIKNVLISGLFPDLKVVPNDLQLLVFIPLCNFLPLNVTHRSVTCFYPEYGKVKEWHSCDYIIYVRLYLTLQPVLKKTSAML